MSGEGIRFEAVAGQKLIDDGTGALNRCLADVFGHIEREPAAIADGERTQRYEVGGLLGFGRLAGGNANDQRPPVFVDNERRVEQSVRAGTVLAGVSHVEPRNCGGG